MPHLPNIIIIGLTGMSGAGKSTVCGVFRENGFRVIDCDVIARKTAEKPEFLNEVRQRFSQRLLNADGSLDRPGVAGLIYNDKPSRDKYQRIIFPYIVYSVIEEIRKSEAPVLLDAPTLFESKLDMLCTKIVSVCAAENVCAKRIAARDNISYTQAVERISAQHNAEFFYKHSDYCIINDKTVRELYGSAQKIIDILKGEL